MFNWILFLLLHVGMARRKLTDGQKWQVVGLSRIGNSNRYIANQSGLNLSVIVRLLQTYLTTGTSPFWETTEDANTRGQSLILLCTSESFLHQKAS